MVGTKGRHLVSVKRVESGFNIFWGCNA